MARIVFKFYLALQLWAGFLFNAIHLMHSVRLQSNYLHTIFMWLRIATSATTFINGDKITLH